MCIAETPYLQPGSPHYLPSPKAPLVTLKEPEDENINGGFSISEGKGALEKWI